MIIPCTTLSFYLVPVAQALSVAVVTGQYPKTQIEVVKYVTFWDTTKS